MADLPHHLFQDVHFRYLRLATPCTAPSTRSYLTTRRNLAGTHLTSVPLALVWVLGLSISFGMAGAQGVMTSGGLVSWRNAELFSMLVCNATIYIVF